MIEVKDLYKAYGSTKAVDGISFKIEKGEVVGLLGPNGAGKTTCMRMLTCYITPDAGDATVGGHSILTQSLEVRKKIGYLPESAPLYTDMNVVDYLTFIAEIHELGANTRDRVGEMVDVCGLKSVVYKDINELSKGFRQRVGLASTMIHDPDYLILDEPTSGLDPNQIVEIRNLIREIGHKREKAVVLSTHILPEVEVTCDRAIIINDGKIIAEGTTNELTGFARGADVYHVKMLGERKSIESSFKSSQMVQSLEYIDAYGSNGHAFRLTSKSDDDISENIFDIAVRDGYKLIGLSRDIASLEDIFRTLTTKEAN